MADQKYNILLTASDETRAAFDSVKNNIEGMGAPLASIRAAVDAVGASMVAVTIIGFVKSISDAAEEANQANLKLQAIYKATGGVVGFTTDALNKMADAMAKVTHFDDEAIREGMAEIIKFGSITGSVFRDSLKVIADYAAFAKMDFPEAASHIAKALADPETAAKLLKQAGVVLTESQKDLIKAFKDVGDEAGAQRVILERLQNTYGGMEKTLNSGLTGATKAFSKEWHELLEELGKSGGGGSTAHLMLNSLADGLKGVREAIAAADEQYKNSLMFNRGKGVPLHLSRLPGMEDTGPLAGKTLADVQAVNAAVAKAQDAATEAANKKAAALREEAEKAAQASLDKLLAITKRFDEETVVSHDDAFTKWITKWKEYEDQLIALGAAGTKARMMHEAAYTVNINAETKKRNADYDTEAAREAAKEAVKAAQRVDALVKAKDYYAKIQAMADDIGASAAKKEKLRYDLELLNLEKEHKEKAAKVAADHAMALDEEERYQVALGNIKAIHQANQLQADETVLTMAYAFKAGKMDEEISATAAYLTKLSSYSASHNQAMFNVNKVASIATAVMNTYKGVSGVLGEFPGPIGWAMAAAQAAMGMAQVAAIQSTQFGGGSASTGGAGVPSMATSPGIPVANYSAVPAAPALARVQTPIPAPQQINITIVGARGNPDAPVMSYNTFVNDIVPLIKEAKSNGYLVDLNVTMG